MIRKGILVALFGLCVVLVCGCLDSSQSAEKSVTIGGYTFTADLDDSWVTIDETAKYKPQDMESLRYGMPAGAYDWTGEEYISAFNYRSGEPEGSITKYGWANIFVLKPKSSYLRESDATPSELLKHATDMIINPRNHRNAVIAGDLTEKEIEYNGKEARLVEVEGEWMGDHPDDNSYGAIAFFLDDDTIALIDVETSNDFGMSAWDVIDSITVTTA